MDCPACEGECGNPDKHNNPTACFAALEQLARQRNHLLSDAERLDTQIGPLLRVLHETHGYGPTVLAAVYGVKQPSMTVKLRRLTDSVATHK